MPSLRGGNQHERCGFLRHSISWPSRQKIAFQCLPVLATCARNAEVGGRLRSVIINQSWISPRLCSPNRLVQPRFVVNHSILLWTADALAVQRRNPEEPLQKGVPIPLVSPFSCLSRFRNRGAPPGTISRSLCVTEGCALIAHFF